MFILWKKLTIQRWKATSDKERVITESGKALWCTENVEDIMGYHPPSSWNFFLMKMRNEFEKCHASCTTFFHVAHVKTACNSADGYANRPISSASYPSSLSSKSDTENSEQILVDCDSSSIKTTTSKSGPQVCAPFVMSLKFDKDCSPCNEYAQSHSDNTTFLLQQGGKHSCLKKCQYAVQGRLNGDTQGSGSKPVQTVTKESVIKSLMTKPSCRKKNRKKRKNKSRVKHDRFAASMSEVTGLSWENQSSRSHESDDL